MKWVVAISPPFTPTLISIRSLSILMFVWSWSFSSYFHFFYLNDSWWVFLMVFCYYFHACRRMWQWRRHLRHQHHLLLPPILHHLYLVFIPTTWYVWLDFKILSRKRRNHHNPSLYHGNTEGSSWCSCLLSHVSWTTLLWNVVTNFRCKKHDNPDLFYTCEKNCHMRKRPLRNLFSLLLDTNLIQSINLTTRHCFRWG